MCVIAKTAYVNSYYLAANTVLFIECVVALLSWPVVGHLGTHLSIRWAVSSIIVRRTRLSSHCHSPRVSGYYLALLGTVCLSTSPCNPVQQSPEHVWRPASSHWGLPMTVSLMYTRSDCRFAFYSFLHRITRRHICCLPACVRCSAQIGSSTWLREIPRISVAPPYHVFLRVHETTTLLLVTLPNIHRFNVFHSQTQQ